MQLSKLCNLPQALISSIGANKINQNFIRLVLAIGLLPLLSLAAQAQVTTGGDGTVVNTAGNTFNITGGTTQGVNLFHSFGQFGVGATQTANFQPNTGITNILGRVVGRDPSVINGAIQVTQPVGSTANINLYLMNPAGIIFGSTATLNVPGSFTATTANAIGFGNNWFNAFGNNNYAALTGNPGDLAFTSSQPGSILNTANLSTQAGKSISLVGGTVISTGTIRTQGGNITIATVPGSKLVRVSNDGTVLALDLPIATKNLIDGNATAFTPLSLPALLTSSTEIQQITANRVTVTGNVVRLVGDTRSISSGDIVTKDLNTAGANGGNVSLLTIPGDIIVNSIDTRSDNFGIGGKGGNVTVKAGGLFRATGYVANDAININPPTDQNGTRISSGLSIFTGGTLSDDEQQALTEPSLRGGTIDITHAGGSFLVGGQVNRTTGNSILSITLTPQFSFTENSSGTIGAIASRNSNGNLNVIFSDGGFSDQNNNKATGFDIKFAPRPVIPVDEGDTGGGTTGGGTTGGVTGGGVTGSVTGGTGNETSGGTDNGNGGNGTGEDSSNTTSNSTNPNKTASEAQIARQQSDTRCDRKSNTSSSDSTNSTADTPNTSAADPCQPNSNWNRILQILNRKN